MSRPETEKYLFLAPWQRNKRPRQRNDAGMLSGPPVVKRRGTLEKTRGRIAKISRLADIRLVMLCADMPQGRAARCETARGRLARLPT